jgi:hypothetical protein
MTFHALGHCGGHLAHQRRAPPFARASERRRAQASDARCGREAGACIGGELLPASVTERCYPPAYPAIESWRVPALTLVATGGRT